MGSMQIRTIHRRVVSRLSAFGRLAICIICVICTTACQPALPKSSSKASGKDEKIPMTKVFAGEEPFEQICMACHRVGDRTHDQLMAPPMMGVQKHYREAYTNQTEFVYAVVSWLQNPDADKSRLPNAVKRFGLMPPMPLPEKQLHAIATYLYAGKMEKPIWWEAHLKEHL